MVNKFLSKLAVPFTCILSTAFAPIGLSANQCCNTSNCCEPCEQTPCCQTGCGINWGTFAGAAAVGAIAGVVAGVVAANSNKSHGKHGDIGPTGATGPAGTSGASGVDGAGFTVATVPSGQPNAGAPVTSLTFTFTTLAALTLIGEDQVQTYVTTPEGRTILGGTFPAVSIGGTATVVISTGPFYSGQYDVGIILPTGLATLAAVVRVEVTNINGTATSPALDDAGIVVGVSLLSTETFFNAQYPFPQTP